MTTQCSNCGPKLARLQQIKGHDFAQHPRSLQEITDPSELLKLNKFLNSAAKEIKRYQLEVVRLHGKMQTLKKRKKAIQDRVLIAKSLLSPIRKVPQEVLGEIFLQILTESGDTSIALVEKGSSRSCWKAEPGRSACRIPLLSVSQACSSWRHIILSTPSLWSSIRIFGNIDHFQNALCDVLDRSGAALLDIELQPAYEYPDQASGFHHSQAVSQLVRSTSDRWRSISLQPLATDMLSLKQLRGKIPKVQKLGFNMCNLKPDTQITVFEEMPSLNHLSLLLSTERLLIPKFPWAHLQRLDLGGLYIIQDLEVVSRCANLLDLSIAFRIPSIPSQPVHVYAGPFKKIMANLKKLSIKGDTSRDKIANILNSATAPSLKDMEICFEWGSFDPIIVPLFKQMIIRSGFSLSRLAIRVYMPILDFLNILDFIPSLTSLYLLEKVSADYRGGAALYLINMLRPMLTHKQGIPAQKMIAPALEYLDIISGDGDGQLKKHQALVLLMVRSRWATRDVGGRISGLKHISLDFGFELDGSVKEQLHKMKAAGLGMDITVNSKYKWRGPRAG